VFEASEPFVFFDYFRVPYRVEDGGSGSGRLGFVRGARGSLVWPREGLLPPAPHELRDIPLYCRVLPDQTAAAWLGAGWGRAEPLTGAEGPASIWRDGDGNVFLPFDPGEAIRSFWSESYQPAGGRRQLATRAYYRLRPALPRRLQIWLRRRFSILQARRRFPRWPLETALQDLYCFLFDEVRALADEPVPSIAPWPNGATWTLVLTHDVETAAGYQSIHLLRDVELSAGFRSSWNLVPKRYEVDDEVVRELLNLGFEIGVHGLYHDGRDLESRATLEERLPEIRRHAERWHAIGFRAPATQRNWELMPLLGFEYDSSYPDTDPFEPQSGGCCSVLPYFNEGLLELPITLPQDHTLFVILGHTSEEIWLEKAAAIRAAGGMALLITHPDYMDDPAMVALYERFLVHFAADPTVWCALPREVSAWWRQRAASHLERAADGWTIVGPAAGSGAISVAA
jgi:hypothetical protein